MTQKKFLLVFYLNLIYSAIPEEDRLTVIKRCYWPLLKLIKKGIPISIQASGVTLEIINDLDPEWISEFKILLKTDNCEFIGNGYAQVIAPLVPSEVNSHNQRFGIDTYEKLLGSRPRVATINEMAYSRGILKHFIDNNYDAVLMEWNNPRMFHTEWDNNWRFFNQKLSDSDNREISLMWVDSIVFQKFQRYAHDQISFEEYIAYIDKIPCQSEDGYVYLYASDTEIFDYRPRRYKTEGDVNKVSSEWIRVGNLFKYLLDSEKYSLLLPSKALKEHQQRIHANNKLNLESPQNPIPVKKQEKYNISRWALTGRKDLEINTKCHKIFDLLTSLGIKDGEKWQKLCFLWSSDFRTHIEDKRWAKYYAELTTYLKELERVNNSLEKPKTKKDPVSQNNVLIEENDKSIIIKNNLINCTLSKKKGLTISSCIFKSVAEESVIGTLEHGYYDDISLGADFYSGHSIIEKPVSHKITDLEESSFLIKRCNSDSITISKTESFGEGKIEKSFTLNNSNKLLLDFKISLPRKESSIIRPMNFTFIPSSFDNNTLYFATHNGGDQIEKFKIKNQSINHFENLSPLISIKYGLGATKGILIIGDKNKAIQIKHNLSDSVLIPSIMYKKIHNNQFILRLHYSAQELDETFRTSSEPYCIQNSIEITPLV